MLRTPGDGRSFSLGTGLLNIAGEKIEGSGILGHSLVFGNMGCGRMFFFCGEKRQNKLGYGQKDGKRA